MVYVLRSTTKIVFSQKSQVRLIKSVKSDSKKQSGRKAVLVVRRLIDDKGFHTKTEVDLKSNRVAEVMREINSDVEEISLRTIPPVVRDILLSHFQIIFLFLLNSQVPLELFYHNRQALQSKLDEELKAEPMDKNLVADLTVATSFAEEEHTAAITCLEQLLASGEITWELLWTIFPPNVLVYRYHPLVEEDQIMKLRAMRQVKRVDKSRYWDFDCHVVGDDGIKFGLAYCLECETT